ncbi:hypothetical protein AXI64_gp013 [Vibrio phage qdvp001]|uniref:hypothetical protein n=1 Tax=Vibrio phage qdvp001 TaxID=1003177 RepID=UPI00072277DB|nr:hypothetical protein AXI64_gp013 [Vibrio phage qdvp001]ALM62005.1 hypothetical protein qdvp001_013 [Vibrio phage qdvp001]
MSKDYWTESLGNILGDYGITLADGDLEKFVDDVIVTKELEHQYCGYDMIPDPIDSEYKRKYEKLLRENESRDLFIKTTIPCKKCNDGVAKDGWGRDVVCPSCNGKGRVKK